MYVHCHEKGYYVSVFHQNEGAIGKSIPDAQEISRDISSVDGNIMGRGGISLGGWISQHIPTLSSVTGKELLRGISVFSSF